MYNRKKLNFIITTVLVVVVVVVIITMIWHDRVESPQTVSRDSSAPNRDRSPLIIHIHTEENKQDTYVC